MTRAKPWRVSASAGFMLFFMSRANCSLWPREKSDAGRELLGDYAQ